MEAMNGFCMAEFIAILFACAFGIFAAGAFTASHETHSERRIRRQSERWVSRNYPPTY
jgi:hypothetical protein